MRAWAAIVHTGLRLHFRNTMAMIYSYLFPTMFLVAFWTIYRYDDVPLVRHMGEVLTITALGGACFGLPTTLVSERERGVWRRYRLTPTSAAVLIGGTLASRYVLLLIAASLQVGLAMALGMPRPVHPIELGVAFSLVACSLMGVGLTIAALADNVPAVQALGQCVFLPMLILGGVAVPLASLPDWARGVSTFFPGRYAVDVLHAAVAGSGIGSAKFSLAALAGIAGAAIAGGVGAFRWDNGQRFRDLRGKPWVLLAFGAWIAVGAAAHLHVAVEDVRRLSSGSAGAPSAPAPRPADAASSSIPPAEPPSTQTPSSPAPAPSSRPATATAGKTSASARAGDWRASTKADIERDIDFSHLPPDSGVVTPVAADGEPLPDDVSAELATIEARIATWPPGQISDPAQRVRNFLVVLAVPDLGERPLERFLPGVIFAHLERTTPPRDLSKLLYWIAIHPDDGTLPTMEDVRALGLQASAASPDDLRNRAAIYGVKLLKQLTERSRTPPSSVR